MKLKTPKTLSNIRVREWGELLRIVKENKPVEEQTKDFIRVFNPDADFRQIKKQQLVDFFESITKVMQHTPGTFKEVIKINGRLYAFEPDPGNMEMGAIEDLTRLQDAPEQHGHLASIMAILYRPVKKLMFRKYYTIESYVDEPQESFVARVALFDDELTAEEVQSCLFFMLQNQKR